MTACLERLLPTDSVVRLRPQRASFPDGPAKAQWDDFVPSTDEKDDAERTGDPILVSVWNEAATKLDQARAIYARPSSLAFRLAVAALEGVEALDGATRLTVLTDPYVDDPRLGAVGHCGVAGLDRRKGEPRPAHRDFLDRIAACAVAC